MTDVTTVLENATVLAGADLSPTSGTSLALRGQRIVSVGGDAGDGDGPRETLDATGLLLVPGFIDAHVHIGFADPGEVLAGGVTTARDLGWPPADIFPLARSSRSASWDGPEILAAGPMLTAPGGYPARAAWAPKGTAREVTSPEDARAAVAEVADAGATIVKFALNPPVGPVLALDVLTAIVEAAHERGLKATGHVYGLGELHKALDAGADEVAHMLMSPEAIPDETIDRMVAAGMAVVPTLSVRFGRDREYALDNLRRFHEAGGTIVYGTDLGNEGPRPGIDRLEVRAMAAAGMTARAIVRSATVAAALWLGLEDRGVIEAGRSADLVALPERALEDAAYLTNVRMVWRAGRRVR